MWLGFYVLCLFSAVRCQTIVPIPEDTKNEIVTRVDSGTNPSIALAAYEDGAIDFYVYGLKNISTGTNATEDTVYDIGSISKTFTSLLLGKLFVEQKLHLWDPLDTYLPVELGLREEDGTPIELIHLATHTSGLPRQPYNMGDDFPENYGQDDLYAFLEFYQPKNVGKNHSYSNVAFGTLGDALSICEDDGRGLKQIIIEDIVELVGLEMFYDPTTAEEDDVMAQGYR